MRSSQAAALGARMIGGDSVVVTTGSEVLL